MQMLQNKAGGMKVGGRIVANLIWLALRAAAVLCLGSSLNAQDALRYSLAGEAASRARKATEDVPYNVKLGPASLRFTTSSTLEYNDNIGVNSGGQASDFIFTPAIGLSAVWPVTAHNALSFSMSVGYSKYFEHDNLDTLLVSATPDSGLSFDVFVGDFRINFHDRFSYYQNPVQQGAISGGTNNTRAASYGTAQNIVGVGVDWDLNKIIASFGYDHSISFATSTNFSRIDQNSDNIFTRVSFLFSPAISPGLEAAAGMTTYDQSTRNNNEQISFGPFVSWRVSEHLSTSVRGGYLYSSFESGGAVTNAAKNAQGSSYGSLSFENEVNKYISQSFSAGYATTLGVNSDSIATTFFRHAVVWRVIRRTDISTDIFYELGKESGSLHPETFTRIGLSGGLRYQLTSKLSSELNIRYTKKNSDQAERDYAQSVISLSLHYRF